MVLHIPKASSLSFHFDTPFFSFSMLISRNRSHSQRRTQRHPKNNSAWKQNECALRIGFVFFNAGEASIHFPTVGCSEAEDRDNSVECQHLARIKNRGTAIHLPVWELREYLTRQLSKRRMISAAHSSCRTTVPGPPSLSTQASKEEEEEEAATLGSECKLPSLYRYM